MNDNKNNSLVLETFLPYRLSFLTNIISRRLARLYSDKFDITPQEWKVLANLTRHPDISAAEISEKAAMDKVAVSRAVRSLCDKGLVYRQFARADRRRSLLNLTDSGRVIYHRIEPLVIDYENHLKNILSADEKAQLDHLLTKLTAHAIEGDDQDR